MCFSFVHILKGNGKSRVVLDPNDYHFMDKNSWNILQNISRDAEFVEQYIFCDIYESTFPMQSTEEPRSDRNPIKDITGQIFDLVSKHNSNSTIIKAITDVRVHETLSPKTGKQHAITLDIVSIFAEK